jgi:hypothetical protein
MCLTGFYIRGGGRAYKLRFLVREFYCHSSIAKHGRREEKKGIFLLNLKVFENWNIVSLERGDMYLFTNSIFQNVFSEWRKRVLS